MKSKKFYVRRSSKKDKFFSSKTGKYESVYKKFNKGDFVVTLRGFRNHIYDYKYNKTQLEALVKLLNMRKKVHEK